MYGVGRGIVVYLGVGTGAYGTGAKFEGKVMIGSAVRRRGERWLYHGAGWGSTGLQPIKAKPVKMC